MSVGSAESDAARTGSVLRERLTLAATDRLARQLREDANLARSRSGAAVWEAPRIASFSRWLTDTWTASWPDAQLLSSTQELVLWREAIERDEAGAQLLTATAAAREARRADQWVRRYRIALDSAPVWQDEHSAFRRWRQHVVRRMAQNHWLTGADIANEVAVLIAQQAIAVPDAIELAGFVGARPASEQAVLDALAARGTHIEFIEPETRSPRITRLLLPDAEAQWRWVAQDIRERLRARPDDPPRCIVALPDPDGSRELGESVLRVLLAPWVARGEGAQPWRWERGRTLGEQPAVDTLLALLQLRVDDNPPELIGRVLLSASLWSQSERAVTAEADYRLRERGATKIGLARVQSLLSPALAARFAAFTTRLAALPKRSLPSDWALRFRDLLDAMGWPGSEALDTQTYQAVRTARGLFDRLGTLDAQLGRVSASSARDWLSELARGTRFAPRVEHTQPLLLTTLDEAAALSCDVLYVLDATAAQLPTAARPTPFLPSETQQIAGIAEASPQLWLARTQAQVARLLGGCAPEVIVCMPKVDARGAELQPSSLFGAASEWSATEASRAVGACESALSETRSAAEMPDADPVPPVDAAEQAALRPDSALFKAWFESPFFAFCCYRLGIEALPQPPHGLDARVQGQLVHGALEDLWGELRNSRALAAMDAGTLAARIEAALIARAAKLLPVVEYGAATRALELARAQDVIAQWLHHETRRLDPFTVELREVRAEPIVAGLQLRLRLDRVDRIETEFGARWLVVDYKTGRDAKTEGWKAERLKEPQLPLYASHAATAAAGIPQVDGICFGHLRDGHPALVAQTNWRKKLIKDPPGDTRAEWDETLIGWRVAIEDAARGFLAGQAWIDARVTDRSHYAALLALTGTGADEEPEA